MHHPEWHPIKSNDGDNQTYITSTTKYHLCLIVAFREGIVLFGAIVDLQGPWKTGLWKEKTWHSMSL